eukprot:1921489-Lingulodinium_polyedra.AAC.1
MLGCHAPGWRDVDAWDRHAVVPEKRVGACPQAWPQATFHDGWQSTSARAVVVVPDVTLHR